MSIYPKPKDPKLVGKGLLQPDRLACKVLNVPSPHATNIIMIHGVNDLGVSFGEVEKGLCAGLNDRLKRFDLTPAAFRGFADQGHENDKNTILPDPDNVYFKRDTKVKFNSPIIPFYWGFREEAGKTSILNGENIDRHGNRLDKDFSKGGGPFANATTNLADMWNKGNYGWFGVPDRIAHDPLRPVLNAPGRMYMVLAAKRLAALIDMIHDYDKNDTVTLVAHSQGCMLSLLAQAFLLDEGKRPADCLILTHPPYSLEDSGNLLYQAANRTGSGKDKAMLDQYDLLDSAQTLHARLTTLVNVVSDVAKKKNTTPEWTSFDTVAKPNGIVGCSWQPDRDNRGKVYLYFCPEDMTTALDNIKAIGWQGIPDAIEGWKAVKNNYGKAEMTMGRLTPIKRQALQELGSGFMQRVFTAKKRNGNYVLVGQAPHDFALKLKGEDDHAHVSDGAADSRANLPEVGDEKSDPRHGWRRITGEALQVPVLATMYAGAQRDNKGRAGAQEGVDGVDAKIALTSQFGLQEVLKLIDCPPHLLDSIRREAAARHRNFQFSPGVWKDTVVELHSDRASKLLAILNAGKSTESLDRIPQIIKVFYCLKNEWRTNMYWGEAAIPMNGTQQLLILRQETPNETVLRQQNSTAARSFHGAIFGAALNHSQVTAYDVAIGGGKASSDPTFYKYLCAVADWKMTNKLDNNRNSVRQWGIFTKDFAAYWAVEPKDRRDLIEQNMLYYDSGILPPLPTLEKRPRMIVCENVNGRVGEPPRQHAHVESNGTDRLAAGAPDDANTLAAETPHQNMAQATVDTPEAGALS